MLFHGWEVSCVHVTCNYRNEVVCVCIQQEGPGLQAQLLSQDLTGGFLLSNPGWRRDPRPQPFFPYRIHLTDRKAHSVLQQILNSSVLDFFQTPGVQPCPNMISCCPIVYSLIGKRRGKIFKKMSSPLPRSELQLLFDSYKFKALWIADRVWGLIGIQATGEVKRMDESRMNTVVSRRRLPEKYQYLRSAWKSSHPRSTWKKSRERVITRECLILEAKEK